MKMSSSFTSKKFSMADQLLARTLTGNYQRHLIEKCPRIPWQDTLYTWFDEIWLCQDMSCICSRHVIGTGNGQKSLRLDVIAGNFWNFWFHHLSLTWPCVELHILSKSLSPMKDSLKDHYYSFVGTICISFLEFETCINSEIKNMWQGKYTSQMQTMHYDVCFSYPYSCFHPIPKNIFHFFTILNHVKSNSSNSHNHWSMFPKVQP